MKWIRSSRCNGATACVEVAPLADGNVALRDSKQEDGPVLVFTPAEWDAFVKGVGAGEFNLPNLRRPLPAGDGSGGDARARVCDGPAGREDTSQVSR